MGKSRYSNTNVNNEILRDSPENGAVSSSFSATTISATTFFGGGSGLNDISLSGVTNLQTELDNKVGGGNNLGGGNEVFKNKSGTTLNFRTLTGGTNTTLTTIGDTIRVDVNIPPDANTFVTGFTYDDVNVFTISQNDNTSFTANINILSGVTYYGDGSGLTNIPISGVTNLQTELDSKIDSDVTNSGEIALIQSTGVVESSNDITYTLTGSSNSKPTIGIGLGGTANTKGGLEINSFVDYNGSPFDYFLYTGVGGQFQNFAGVGLFAISVHTVGRFMGSGIHIFSDERIKKDIEVSNSKEDLETISKIEICDYKYIDIVKGGTEKKVIAQQVKKHYPIAVNEGTDVIPCFMQQGELKNGIINLELDCVVGDRIKLIYSNGEEEITSVIEVSDKIIKVDSTKNDKVFVYGKEVNDYQTVDYDSLSMLNISATQELYKIIKDLKAEIEELKKTCKK